MPRSHSFGHAALPNQLMFCTTSQDSAPTTLPRKQAHCRGFHCFSHVKADLNLPQAAKAHTTRSGEGLVNRQKTATSEDGGLTCNRRPSAKIGAGPVPQHHSPTAPFAALQHRTSLRRVSIGSAADKHVHPQHATRAGSILQSQHRETSPRRR